VGDIYLRPIFPRRCLRLTTARRSFAARCRTDVLREFRPDKYRDELAVGRGYLSPTDLSAEMSPPSPVIEKATNPIHIGRKVSTGINIPVEQMVAYF